MARRTCNTQHEVCYRDENDVGGIMFPDDCPPYFFCGEGWSLQFGPSLNAAQCRHLAKRLTDAADRMEQDGRRATRRD